MVKQQNFYGYYHAGFIKIGAYQITTNLVRNIYKDLLEEPAHYGRDRILHLI